MKTRREHKKNELKLNSFLSNNIKVQKNLGKEVFLINEELDYLDILFNLINRCYIKKTTSEKYNKENKDKIKKYTKKYLNINKQSIIKKGKKYRKDNIFIKKQYYLENKKKINTYSCNYKSKRRLTDPLFKLTMNTRSSIGSAIRRKGYTKKTNTYKILGCEYNVFAEWLDLNNYNEDSHLDHVVPISLANTEKEVLLLNHYSNFQLLTSKENLSKGNKYIYNDNLQRVLDNHPNPKIVKKIVNRSNIEIKKRHSIKNAFLKIRNY